MKKSQKWLLSLMVIVPAIIILICLLIADIRINDLPLVVIIVLPTTILATPFLFLAAQRFAQKTDNAPLQKKRKTLLILFGVSLIISTVFIVSAYFFVSFYSWISLLLGLVIFTLFPVLKNIHVFFPKDKKSTTDDDNLQ